MTALTSGHSFTYPLVTDRPCDWPDAALALANTLDLVARAWDVDTGRLAQRKMAKISKSLFTFKGKGQLSFDTVEFNIGTTTDLTVDPNMLRLPAGYWLLTAKAILPTASSGQNYHFELYPDFSGSLITMSGGGGVLAADSRDFGGSSVTTIVTQDLARVTTDATRVGLYLDDFVTGNFTIDYVSIAAFWLADF